MPEPTFKQSEPRRRKKAYRPTLQEVILGLCWPPTHANDIGFLDAVARFLSPIPVSALRPDRFPIREFQVGSHSGTAGDFLLMVVDTAWEEHAQGLAPGTLLLPAIQ